jgi:hypothetical protein
MIRAFGTVIALRGLAIAAPAIWAGRKKHKSQRSIRFTKSIKSLDNVEESGGKTNGI